jgi:hypothetical protein
LRWSLQTVFASSASPLSANVGERGCEQSNSEGESACGGCVVTKVVTSCRACWACRRRPTGMLPSVS